MTSDLGLMGGIVVGVVEDLEDPQAQGRVRVRFPWLEEVVSGWARVVSVGAGADRGMFFRPEPDDEVLVAFELGDFRRPYVLGGLWNGKDAPPADDRDAKANNWRTIRSRSGHILRFDDTDGAEKIELVDKDEARRLVIDCSGKTIEVTSDQGDVKVQAADGAVEVQASGDVTVVSDSGSVSVQGAQTVSVQATNVSLQADANCEIKAGGILTLKGSMVEIN